MAITVQTIFDYLEDNMLDTTAGAVDQNQKIRALHKACELMVRNMDHPASIRRAEIEFLDTLTEYTLESLAPDIKDARDLRRKEEVDHDRYMGFDDQDTLAWRVGKAQHAKERFAIETRDAKKYLRILLTPKYAATTVQSMDSITTDGTWAADTSGSDATNITLDTVSFREGTASLNFDTDVSQSANDLATIYVPDMTAKDWSEKEDLDSIVFDVFIPDVTNISSIGVTWSSDASSTPSTIANYWAITTTTDYAGNSLATGWNTIKVDWNDSTETGSPDASAIVYLQLDVNYTASQSDDTDFRIDNIRIARPETLYLYYFSWYTFRNTSGAWIARPSATTDVPFWSGVDESLLGPTVDLAAKWVSHMNNDDGNYLKFEQEGLSALKEVIRRYPSRRRKPTGGLRLRKRGPRMGR